MKEVFATRHHDLLIGFTSITFVVSFVFVRPAVAQSLQLPSKPIWELSPPVPVDRSLSWAAVDDFGAVPPSYAPIPAKINPAELAALPRVEGPYKSRGIYGVGGGVRSGLYSGGSTSGVITARVGYKLNEDVSVSFRPSGVYEGNNSNDNNNNFNNFNNSSWGTRLPLTIDFFNRGLLTPFVGGGVATNYNNSGYTYGMITGGLDINITKWVTIGLNSNYIFRDNSNDSENKSWEALGLIYLRF